MKDIELQIAEQLYHGEEEAVASLIQQALDAGVTAEDILANGLLPGMDHVGKDFKCGDLFVPEVLLAARTMQAGMEVLRPHLIPGLAPTVGKYVIGTVKGDLHDIGKSIVKLMLEGAGFVGIDLGTDVSPEAFVKAVREHKPDILAMSALLTTTMVEMSATILALKEAGLRESVKVIVGGAPVTLSYSEDIKADGYAPDSARAVDVARNLVG